MFHRQPHSPAAGPFSRTGSTSPSRASGPRRLKSLAEASRGAWVAAAVLLVLAGSLASWLGARAVAHSDAGKGRLAFHLASAEIASTLTLAIQHEEDLVVSASAYVTGNPRGSAAAFDRWVEAVRALQRYPELQNIGLVNLVPAARLEAFEARMAADPLRPLGPQSSVPKGSFQILPAGTRPYYCFAVAGLARSAATYIPPGLDYCALAPTLINGVGSGQSSYAPFMEGGKTTLGVETPVYRGGVVPKTVAARRRDFVGWLGELLLPQVVLARALEGHPNVAVVFRYDSGRTHVAFASGHAPAHAQTTSIRLYNGWSVQSSSPQVAVGVGDNRDALALLLGGVLLSGLLGVLVLVLGTGRTRALSLVREKTRELSHQALHDALTGLPNRALVLDRAEQMLARAARAPGTRAGALYIDIDGFKHVNDNLGHAAGDQLLKAVGARLQSTVREQDTVGRLGGDEFVVLVESLIDEAALDVLADRLTEVLRQPIELDDGRKIFSVTASIGVAIGQYSAPDHLLRDADLALYAAKAAGKDRYALFDASMYEGVEGRLELEADLSVALQEEQFFLVYQPIFDLPRRTVVGVEALIRWSHPVRGVVRPDSFIPLAEESGMIAPIGRWVLEEACRQAAAWTAEGRPLGISVNVSAFQLGRNGLLDDVRGALQRSGIAPSSLTLEVTETTIMRDMLAACNRLEEIKGLGVRVAIDDFGTGYASLSHLQRMPVDILKIDRSFVAALHDGAHSRELLQAILGVGRALSLSVVAEGVEDDEQLRALEEMGCEMAQGFLMGEPGPAELIERIMNPATRGRAVGSQTV
jgi:diguanylate cyclase (GGDEF)-like protein